MSKEHDLAAYQFGLRVHAAASKPSEFDYDVVNQISAPCSEETRERFAYIVASHRLYEVMKLQDELNRLKSTLAWER